MKSPRFEGEAGVIERRRWLFALLAFLPGLSQLPHWLGWSSIAGSLTTIAMSLVGLIGIIALPIWERRRDPRLLRVRADEQGLHVEGRPSVPRAHIFAAYASPQADGSTRVRVVTRKGAGMTEIAVGDAVTANELLAALGHGPHQRRVKFAAFRTSPTRRMLEFSGVPALGVLAGTFAALQMRAAVHGGLLLAFLCPFVALYLMLVFRSGIQIEVGVDGLLVTGTFRKARFVPYAELADVKLDAPRVTLHLRSGEAIDAWFGGAAAQRAGQAEALVARIEDARRVEAADSGEEAPAARFDARTLVAKNDRDVATWARELRSLGDGATTRYRVADVPREALWRIVEDPGADGSARAGAAVALRRGLDDEGRARLRVASAATAAPEVSAALARIADVEADDEAAVEQALAKLA